MVTSIKYMNKLLKLNNNLRKVHNKDNLNYDNIKIVCMMSRSNRNFNKKENKEVFNC